MAVALSDLQAEEQIIAELEELGVRYLSRQMPIEAASVRPPAYLLAELMLQPSSRVRVASIALLLAQPDYAAYAAAALKKLNPTQTQTFKFFHTAAVLLQRQYAQTLRGFLGDQWR